MNPILLKPMGGASQVVLDGAPWGVLTARDYYAAKDRLWPRVVAAYDRLAARFDRIVLEGAGSPVEINLIEHDLTNLRMAHHADAAVVLVADIERGGVFAQLLGTWELMGPEDRARVVGLVINKFRGDATLLEPGLRFLEERTGCRCWASCPTGPTCRSTRKIRSGIDETATDEADERAPTRSTWPSPGCRA
jgi:adenosylcobyric acid synthase